MLDNDQGERWEIVHSANEEPTVRRYTVPGGWLYQVQDVQGGAWQPPVFVPAPRQTS